MKRRATQDKTPEQARQEISMITELIENLTIYPLTGNAYWKSHPSKHHQRFIGSKAGYVNPKGYRVIKFKGRLHGLHRVIFYYVNGWLPNELDHKDRNPSNNSISNIRPTTTMLNTRNRKLTKGSKSGKIGVTYELGKWRARIMVNKKDKSLGTYKTCGEAIQARVKAEKLYW